MRWSRSGVSRRRKSGAVVGAISTRGWTDGELPHRRGPPSPAAQAPAPEAATLDAAQALPGGEVNVLLLTQRMCREFLMDHFGLGELWASALGWAWTLTAIVGGIGVVVMLGVMAILEAVK